MKLRPFALASLAGLALAPPVFGFTPTLVAQWDQCGGYSISMKITGPFAGYSCETADDFEVPASDYGWQVAEVHAPGQLNYGLLATVDVVFYRSIGNGPGEAICERRGLTDFVLSDGDLTIELPLPCELPLAAEADTRYWLSVQPAASEGTLAGWGWTERDVLEHSPAVWRNPSGGAGYGCQTWSARGECLDHSRPDQCFALLGFPALFSSGFETGDTSRWSVAVE